jgi:hypothetical protein
MKDDIAHVPYKKQERARRLKYWLTLIIRERRYHAGRQVLTASRKKPVCRSVT